jgi:hypothetical protein
MTGVSESAQGMIGGGTIMDKLRQTIDDTKMVMTMLLLLCLPL